MVIARVPLGRQRAHTRSGGSLPTQTNQPRIGRTGLNTTAYAARRHGSASRPCAVCKPKPLPTSELGLPEPRRRHLGPAGDAVTRRHCIDQPTQAPDFTAYFGAE